MTTTIGGTSAAPRDARDRAESNTIIITTTTRAPLAPMPVGSDEFSIAKVLFEQLATLASDTHE